MAPPAMIPKSSVTDKNDGEQPPPGISPKDWANIPVSVRKLIDPLRGPSQERRARPENRLPIWVILLLNLVILVTLTLFLVNKAVLPCVTPHQVSALSTAIISLILFHLIWRDVSSLVPPNLVEVIKLPIVSIPLDRLITILDEIHPWRLPRRLLGALFVVLFAAAAFLNLSPISPFYIRDELSAVQNFLIQRLDKSSPEQLAPGETLTLKVGERVLVEVSFFGKGETSCTWFSATSNQNTKTGCSIVLDVPPGITRDTLTVLTQSACGTRQEFAGLHVVVQP